MCPFNNDTWNLPSNFEAFEIESGLIKEWFLRLISNLAFNHSSFVLYFFLHTSFVCHYVPPLLVLGVGYNPTPPSSSVTYPWSPPGHKKDYNLSLKSIIVSQKPNGICITILTRLIKTRTDLSGFTFLFTHFCFYPTFGLTCQHTNIG